MFFKTIKFIKLIELKKFIKFTKFFYEKFYKFYHGLPCMGEINRNGNLDNSKSTYSLTLRSKRLTKEKRSSSTFWETI